MSKTLNFRNQCIFFSSYAQPTKQLIASSSPFKTQQSGNDYISFLCKQGLYKEALRAFDYMESNRHFEIHLSTYAHLILACSHLKSLEHGRRIHAHLSKSSSQPDVILNNHIINMYGKCRSLKDAENVFGAMPVRNAVTWTSMISGYSQNSLEEESVDMYLKMRRSGFEPDQFAFGSVIRACSGLDDLELGKQLHCHALKSEFGSDQIVQNALVAMYVKLDRIDAASDVFAQIETKDLISWGSMIAGFAQRSYESEALHLFNAMLSLGVYCPNEFIFGSIFSACSGIFQMEYGKQAHVLSLKFGLGRDTFVGCSLCDMYAKCGCLDSAEKAFYQIEGPDKVSWNSIIAGFAYIDDVKKAIFFFSQMRNSGFYPDEVTIRCLLCSCSSPSSLYQGQQIHSYVIKAGYDTNVPVCNTLLSMYAKCSDLTNAFNIFKELNDNRDLVSWNSILTTCMQHELVDEAFHLIQLMHSYGHKFDQISLVNALGACSHYASLEMGNQIHCYSVKLGLGIDLAVANGLIDMYAKCGNLHDARKVFALMSNPDVVSWSSLIVGYSQFGYGKQALELFKQMGALDVKPNHVTFVGVLTACSHVGLVDEGYCYYRTMKTDHGILPTREHTSCVVDLFARAGRLKEAETFINEMPFDPDIVVWKSLLAACRIFGDLQLGKRAAENILKLDPSNSAAYVLLCNIYASAGSWDDVARLRKLMKTMGVKKFPGQSWIKVQNEVHVFMVEDQSHPEIDKIYLMLGDLFLLMREAGYTPNQRFCFG